MKESTSTTERPKTNDLEIKLEPANIKHLDFETLLYQF
jgi:hypothetical protein